MLRIYICATPTPIFVLRLKIKKQRKYIKTQETKELEIGIIRHGIQKEELLMFE